jgi:hypothetical protein
MSISKLIKAPTQTIPFSPGKGPSSVYISNTAKPIDEFTGIDQKALITDIQKLFNHPCSQ